MDNEFTSLKDKLLNEIKQYLKVEEDPIILLLLKQAINKVITKRYPFGFNDVQQYKAVVQYQSIVIDIVVYLYNRQGSEGQTGHSENGVNRSYESAGIPDSYLSSIVPVAKCGLYQKKKECGYEVSGT